MRKIGGGISAIAVVKAKSDCLCAECQKRVIKRGEICYARRPGKEHICSSCGTKHEGWPVLDRSKFKDPLKASKQAAAGARTEEE